MRKQLFKDLLTSINQAREINENRMVCPNCERKLPNESYITENRLCVWCDVSYWKK